MSRQSRKYESPVSDSPTPWAIICDPVDMHGVGVMSGGCGQVFLTRKEYLRQLSLPDARWVCPKCGASPVDFDDENYSEKLENRKCKN